MQRSIIFDESITPKLVLDRNRIAQYHLGDGDEPLHNLTRNKVTAEYLVTDKVSIWKQILVHDARRRSAQSLQLRDQPS